MRNSQIENETVDWFANGMKEKLSENRHKPHWNTQDQEYNIYRLREEIEELKDAISQGDTKDIVREAYDVANFAMFIYFLKKKDWYGECKRKEAKKDVT